MADQKKQMKVAVLGDGGWGTALGLTAYSNGHKVVVWGAFQDNVDAVNTEHTNARFLPGIPLPEDMLFTTCMAEAVKDAALVVLASPSQYLRGTVEKLAPVLDRKKQIVVDISKGVETGTLLRMSEVCEEILGKTRYVVLSGPSHAEEVSRKIPTAIVAASRDTAAAKFVQKAFMNSFFRVYTSRDVVGVELGGALKNVFAIAAGIIDGAGMGDNTKAALMTRGIAEMARLGAKLGGQKRTFSGLSGVGDLIVTCMSRHSRNRYVGEELGKGRKLDEIIRSMNMVVAEGVKTCDGAYMLAQKAEVETPIINGIYDILYRNRKPLDVLAELMTRKAKIEHV